jgi:hypothetical protein
MVARPRWRWEGGRGTPYTPTTPVAENRVGGTGFFALPSPPKTMSKEDEYDFLFKGECLSLLRWPPMVVLSCSPLQSTSLQSGSFVIVEQGTSGSTHRCVLCGVHTSERCDASIISQRVATACRFSARCFLFTRTPPLLCTVVGERKATRQ